VRPVEAAGDYLIFIHDREFMVHDQWLAALRTVAQTELNNGNRISL
jgi:hypothetical protein